MYSIEFRNQIRIDPALPVDANNGDFLFRQPSGYEEQDISSSVSAAGDQIKSWASFELSEKDVAALEKCKPNNRPPKGLSEKVDKIGSQLSDANKRLFWLVIQEFGIIRKHNLLSDGGTQWSRDGSQWQSAPGFQIHMADCEIHSPLTLGSSTQEFIQSVLNRQEEPLVAILHLREAQERRGRRFRWVEATIAAELAIKETLIRLEPKLAPLLLEVPSPPINKLYGVILESACGVRSPFTSKLQKGSEKRNRIVHRPESVSFGHQETADYVGTVEEAIKHLISLTRKTPPDTERLPRSV